MLLSIVPKLPMRDKVLTKNFYTSQLGFVEEGDFEGYLILKRGEIELHFFQFEALLPEENYGQVYIRVNDIHVLFEELKRNNVSIHPNGPLQVKTWGQIEFSLLDPDNNLLTFGQSR